jgi:membrane protease YdiL (CAAX protease family)
MNKGASYVDILKLVSVVVLIALPPWMVMRKYIKHRVNGVVRFIVFIIYIAATVFTQNFIPFIAVLISIYFIKRTRDRDEEIYYLRPLGDKKLGVVLNSLIFKFIITIINLWFAFFLTSYGVKLQEQEVSKMFLNAGWLKIIILSIMTVIIAPVLEEFVFRHILYRNFAKKIGKIASGALTSGLFTLLHFNLAGSISFFGVGIYNCYLYEKYGYRAAVLNHFIFNLISTVFIIIIKALNLKIA